MIIGISGKKQSGKDTVGEIIQYFTRQNKDHKGMIHAPKHFIQGLKQYPTKGQISTLGYLKGIQPTFKVKKFADKIKDIVCLLINCTREELENEEFKEKELGEEWWLIMENKGLIGDVYYPYLDSPNKQYDAIHCAVIKLTPRKLLQLLDTDCGRDIIHPNIWINSVMNRYKSINSVQAISTGVDNVYPNWIITDVRFSNELKAIEDKGGISIRVNRPRLSCRNIAIKLGKEKFGKDWKDEFLDEKFIKDVDTYGKEKEHPSETALDNAEFTYVVNNNGTIEKLVEQVREILIKEKIL